jgi:hypothetical protein
MAEVFSDPFAESLTVIKRLRLNIPLVCLTAARFDLSKITHAIVSRKDGMEFGPQTYRCAMSDRRTFQKGPRTRFAIWLPKSRYNGPTILEPHNMG